MDRGRPETWMDYLVGVCLMPFDKVNVNKIISDRLASDPELKDLWDDSRSEYRLLGELVKIRKVKGISHIPS